MRLGTNSIRNVGQNKSMLISVTGQLPKITSPRHRSTATPLDALYSLFSMLCLYKNGRNRPCNRLQFINPSQNESSQLKLKHLLIFRCLSINETIAFEIEIEWSEDEAAIINLRISNICRTNANGLKGLSAFSSKNICKFTCKMRFPEKQNLPDRFNASEVMELNVFSKFKPEGIDGMNKQGFFRTKWPTTPQMT